MARARPGMFFFRFFNMFPDHGIISLVARLLNVVIGRYVELVTLRLLIAFVHVYSFYVFVVIDELITLYS